jgi:hypothetical protein
MAGIKQIVAPPETFRFPRWKSNINYAPDSVIASNSYGLDSDSTSLYIAKVFIPAGQNRPNLNANWVEMAADAAAINAIVRAQLDQDSDMIVMRAVNRRLDSETDRQRQVDSDFQKEADSEYHWWRAKDSDMSRKFSLMLDSEMHDRKAADSDLNVRVDDADSDIRMVIHDYRSADSDFSDRITELKLFDLFDVKERTAQIVKQGSILRYDSDSEAWVPTDDLTILESNVDSDITWLRGRVLVLESENDSDNYVQNADHDSDVKMLYHDYRAIDSDLTIRINDADSDILMTRHDFRAADSDVIAYLTQPTTLDYGTYF